MRIENEIDKTVKMPVRIKARKNSKYPFRDMDVGDSVFSLEDGGSQSKAAQAAYAWGSNNGRSFMARAIDGGVRIWRVK